MIERVARALWLHDKDAAYRVALWFNAMGGTPPPTHSVLNLRWDQCSEIYRARGRAAIAAMREPTAAMVKAADKFFGPFESFSRMVIKGYRSMIDAALGGE